METTHFNLEKLASGVYAAIATEGGAGYSNAGVVDLGHRLIVIDAGDSIRAAQELRAAAEELAGKPVTYLINTHSHGDHFGGDQAFMGVPVRIATDDARQAMEPYAAQLRARRENPDQLRQMLAQEQERLAKATAPAQRAVSERTIRRMTGWLEEAPMVSPYLPNLTFDGSMTFWGTARKAELRTLGCGHSPGDAFLFLPADGVVFTGDLLFSRRQPYMGSCDPKAWIAQLQVLEGLSASAYVPGHGPVASRADLALEREYILALLDIVDRAITAGKSPEDVMQERLPEPFASWPPDGRPTEVNVRALFDRLGKK